MAQMVKNLSAMRETRVWSLVWEDALNKGMATHSSILAWRIPWAEEPGGLQSMGTQRARYDWATEHIQSHNICDLWGKKYFHWLGLVSSVNRRKMSDKENVTWRRIIIQPGAGCMNLNDCPVKEEGGHIAPSAGRSVHSSAL